MTVSAASAPAFPIKRVLARATDTRALFAALFALSLVPVLTNPIPAMVDYVNHLARMYELTAQGTPQASPFYHVNWKFFPNLAMDLIVPLLARWTGVETATRLFLLASQILVVTGSVAIERRVKGRFEISGFVALLYLYNVPFAWGFLNFEFAIGVGLWGIAAWLAVRERPWPLRLGVHALFVAMLFAAHLFALGLYGVTLGLHEAWATRCGERPLRRIFATAALLAAPALVLATIMMATGGSVGGSLNLWQGYFKPFWPLLLLNGDSLAVSVIGTIMLGVLLVDLAQHGELTIIGPGRWIAAGFLGLYVLVPGRMLDTAFADIRVLVGAILILPAFVSVGFSNARRARIAAMVVAGVTVVNVACVDIVWARYQPIYREMIGSFARLSPHARVLVGQIGPPADPPILDLSSYPLYHAPALAAHYAGAFVPTLFAVAGKQPLTVDRDVARLSFPNGGPIPLDALRRATVGDRASRAKPGSLLRDWPRDFDYVYLLGEPVEEPIPAVLALIEHHSTFSVYRSLARPDPRVRERVTAPERP